MFRWQMRDINKYLLAPIGENGRSVLVCRPQTNHITIYSMKNKFDKQIQKRIYLMSKYVSDPIGGNAQTNLIQSTQNQFHSKKPSRCASLVDWYIWLNMWHWLCWLELQVEVQLDFERDMLFMLCWHTNCFSDSVVMLSCQTFDFFWYTWHFSCVSTLQKSAI